MVAQFLHSLTRSAKRAVPRTSNLYRTTHNPFKEDNICDQRLPPPRPEKRLTCPLRPHARAHISCYGGGGCMGLCELPDANPRPLSSPQQAFPGSPANADGAPPDIVLEWLPTPDCTTRKPRKHGGSSETQRIQCYRSVSTKRACLP